MIEKHSKILSSGLDSSKISTEKEISTKKIGDYIILEELGKGTFSKVCKGLHIITGQKVAIKILDKSKIKDEIDIERILREIEILKKVFHPNISQMYEFTSSNQNYYLFLEYAEGGDLFNYIVTENNLKEIKACYYFRQLINVIDYLSEIGITHRDIKPENILLDKKKKNIKIIDFGLSNYCKKNEFLKSSCGSPCFASPEMLSGQPYKGISADLWAAGVVLYSMLVGGFPFDSQDIPSLYQSIKNGKFYLPSYLSLEAMDLLKKMLEVDVNKRISIEDVKKHKWFNMGNNILYKGVNLNKENLRYNLKVIEYIIENYFEKDITEEKIINMIKINACNKYTSTYYLTKKYILAVNEKEHEYYIKIYNKIIKNNNKNENDAINKKINNNLDNTNKNYIISYITDTKTGDNNNRINIYNINNYKSNPNILNNSDNVNKKNNCNSSKISCNNSNIKYKKNKKYKNSRNNNNSTINYMKETSFENSNGLIEKSNKTKFEEFIIQNYKKIIGYNSINFNDKSKSINEKDKEKKNYNKLTMHKFKSQNHIDFQKYKKLHIKHKLQEHVRDKVTQSENLNYNNYSEINHYEPKQKHKKNIIEKLKKINTSINIDNISNNHNHKNVNILKNESNNNYFNHINNNSIAKKSSYINKKKTYSKVNFKKINTMTDLIQNSRNNNNLKNNLNDPHNLNYFKSVNENMSKIDDNYKKTINTYHPSKTTNLNEIDFYYYNNNLSNNNKIGLLNESKSNNTIIRKEYLKKNKLKMGLSKKLKRLGTLNIKKNNETMTNNNRYCNTSINSPILNGRFINVGKLQNYLLYNNIKNNKSLRPSLKNSKKYLRISEININNEKSSSYNKYKSKNVTTLKSFNEKSKKYDIFKRPEIINTYSRKNNMDYIDRVNISLNKVDKDQHIFNKNYDWMNRFRKNKDGKNSANNISVLIKKNITNKLNIFK